MQVFAEGFQSVNYLCLFLLLLMESKEGEKCSKKKRNLWQPGAFSLFLGMFHLVKAQEWREFLYQAEVNGFGDFSRGVCIDQSVWVS